MVGGGETVGCFVDFCFVGLNVVVGCGESVGAFVGFGVLAAFSSSSSSLLSSCTLVSDVYLILLVGAADGT
jgi:hypothetical protein